MRSLALTTMLALATTALMPGAASAAPPATDMRIPIAGSGSGLAFVGTFALDRFVATSTGVAAVGTIVGTVTDTAGNVTSVVRNVTMPAAGIHATCDILHLELGPLDLDLLGLVVHLNQIVLDIDAQSGPGKLLGNLLCAVVGLLDNPSGLARVLNDILAILG
jgi:hypothetical protein